MQIKTLPVYSKLANPFDVANQQPLHQKLQEIEQHTGKSFTLSQHQLATYEALINPDIDVVINTAMTGDGKSLAAYLPTLIYPDRGAFGMYPTNELARDQRRQFEQYNTDFKSNLHFTALWGAKIGQIIEEHPEFARRADALSSILDSYQVVLTNPDIFHLMINYRYGSQVLSNQELPARLTAYYGDFIFDEFHIFSTPQMVSAITAMLFFCATANLNKPDRPRFLFSSATPSSVFTDLLRASDLRVCQISGTYRATPADGYRQVLHGADLTLHKLGEQQNVEQWLQDNLALIQNHWQNSDLPRPRGAVIVNSVVEARRIARFLQRELQGISVGENTGLTDDERRKLAMADADIIVGTSTIDVGVDFNISLLIFEAPDAGTFLQRLGRLGRCRRDGTTFAHYEAHALFNGRTPWIYDNFVKELTDRDIRAGDSVDRPTLLRDAASAAFPHTTDFRRYVRRWGALQAAHIIHTLEDPRRGGTHTEAAAKLRQQYQHALNLKDINKAVGRYRSMHLSKNEPGSTTCRAILDEVLTFRGSSSFQAGIWDDSVDPSAFLTYDTFVIAQSSEICIADYESFKQALIERHPDSEQRKAVLGQLRYGLKHEDHPLILYVDEFWSEKERLLLQIDRFDPKIQTNCVLLLKGLSIKKPRTEETKLLNPILRRQAVIAYVTKRDTTELRRRLRLPPFFPLYQVEDSHEVRYTLALGQAALLLEAEALWLRNKDEEEAPIIL
jgi:CRISPR-associated endonuclease/helicase Cas3